MHRRLGIFLHALARRFGHIDMLHITPRDKRFDRPAALNEAQSAFWGVPVHAHWTERRDDWTSWWTDHGLGLFDLGEQHPFRRFTGAGVLRSVAAQLNSKPDFLFVDRIEAMLPLLRLGRPMPPLLFDLNDVEHKMWTGSWQGTPKTLRNVLHRSKLPALMRAERRAVQVSGAAAVCSNVDRDHLIGLGFGQSIVTVPNAVPVPDSVPGVAPEPTLLFLGACSYPPNVEAAERLVTCIWPLIRAVLPSARLILAGAQTDRLPSAKTAPDGVEFRGFVDSLDRLYAETRVVCCPLLTGGGTRLKLVEAAAYARPMISTALGAEGLDFTDGHDILIRETDGDIASACVALLQDEVSCLRLGSAARVTMARLYDVQAVVQQVDTLIGQLCVGKSDAGNHNGPL